MLCLATSVSRRFTEASAVQSVTLRHAWRKACSVTSVTQQSICLVKLSKVQPACALPPPLPFQVGQVLVPLLNK